jgi:hypothetical protein
MISAQSNYCPRALRPSFHHLASVFCTMVISGVVRVNALASPPSVTVVDIIPEFEWFSGETDANTEPDLAVNPANASQMAAFASFSDPIGANLSWILVSTDGGTTWKPHSTVPIDQMSQDATLQFSGLSNMLYVAALNDNWQFFVCRSSELAQRAMDSPLRQLQSKVDQPYIVAATIDQKDRIFVGVNDWDGPRRRSNGKETARTAALVRSLDGTAKSPNSDFTHVPIEFGDPVRDSAEIRPAVSADGKKVYSVFNRLISIDGNKRVGDVILVRDDEGGNSGAASFTALHDDNGVAGFPVVKARTFLFDWDDGASIAVDPQHAETVYLVWGEVLDDQPVLHVTRSTDGGQKWSGILHTVKNAKNPGLAINNNGTLAFLYQQVVTDAGGQETWFTKVELTKDDFQSVNSLTLSKFPVAELDKIDIQPRLGDYLRLTAVKDTFYGIFAASNVPDQSRFPSGVTFQRPKDFATKKLLNQDGKEVQSSVDPFFFKVTEQ